ncbi:MAG TPA: hypothetical protein VF503_21910 [Sphingobium sp.]|uniref:hypothetical protein n=1 Tax=Sphingobium sp. TaxID=1912891 RepID=UPI002ED07046
MSDLMDREIPYFRRVDQFYIPTEASAGYWTPGSLNGRLFVGLMGFELERIFGSDEWQPARLTVDMYRMPKLAPIKVVTRVVHAGGRLRLVEAEFLSEGEQKGRATCQLLRRTSPPPGVYFPTPGWTVPPPDALADAPQMGTRLWDVRLIDGGIGQPWPRRVWVRDTRELVGGYPTSPFTRIAFAADYCSPLANSGLEAIGYINSDVTLYLHRLPVGEWIGLEAVQHQSADGIVNGTCWLYDEQGPIGSATAAGIAQVRRPADEPGS